MAPRVSKPVPSTVDAFFDGRMMIEQPARGYRAGLDAVLLATTVTPGLGHAVIDLGAGVGTVGLGLAVRAEGCRTTLVEREPELASLAARNIERNGLAGRARVIVADVAAPLSRAPDLARLRETFDLCTMNPPFFEDGRGTASSDPIKGGANSMPEGALDDWIRCAATMLKPGGQLALIHRAESLAEIFAALSTRFGAIKVTMVHPVTERPANRVIVVATKSSRAPTQITPPLIVHVRPGEWTPAIEAALRTGAPWRG